MSVCAKTFLTSVRGHLCSQSSEITAMLFSEIAFFIWAAAPPKPASRVLFNSHGGNRNECCSAAAKSQQG